MPPLATRFSLRVAGSTSAGNISLSTALRTTDVGTLRITHHVYGVGSDCVCLRRSGEVFRRALGQIRIGDVAYVVHTLPTP